MLDIKNNNEEFTPITRMSVTNSLPAIKTVPEEETHLPASLINLAYYVFKPQEDYNAALRMLHLKFPERQFEVVLRSDWIRSCHKSRLKAIAVEEIKEGGEKTLYIAIGGTTEKKDYVDCFHAMAATKFAYAHTSNKIPSIREFISHKNLFPYKDVFKEISGHSLGGLVAMHMVCEYASLGNENFSCRTLSSLCSEYVIGQEVKKHNENPISGRCFLGNNPINFDPKEKCINYSSEGDFGFARGPDWGKTVYLEKKLPEFETKWFCKKLNWLIDGLGGNYAQHALKFFLEERFYEEEHFVKTNSKHILPFFQHHYEYSEDIIKFIPLFEAVCKEMLSSTELIGDVQGVAVVD